MVSYCDSCLHCLSLELIGINIALICCSQYMFCLNDMWLFSDKLKEELVKERSAKEVVSFPDM